MEYDVIIVGAGPAGIFAACDLIKEDSSKKILLVDKGNLIKNRAKNEVMTGFGGAGTFSDGKLHFTPVLSHEKMFHLYSPQEYQEYMNSVEEMMLNFGVPADYYPRDMAATEKLVEGAKKKNINLYVRRAIHVGSDKLPAIMQNFENYLIDKGVECRGMTEVVDILVEGQEVKGVKLNGGEEIISKSVLLCPGRYNAKWLQNIAEKYSLSHVYDKIEVGVRVEFPSDILKRHADQMYETVFTMYTPTYDDLIRTFCPCPKGHVAIEEYDGFVCVNGHSNSTHDSENSNFAFVTEVNLTEPLEDTRAYASFISMGATLLGSGKPIVQRLKDLKAGRRSTPSRLSHMHMLPSLKEAVPGDIGMAMPYRITKNIIEGIAMLDKVLPGLDGDSTLLYAPEVKFRSSKIETNKMLETEINNLFVAGDAAGLSGNIVGAAVTGLIAAKGILDKLKIKKETRLISN